MRIGLKKNLKLIFKNRAGLKKSIQQAFDAVSLRKIV